MCFLVLEINLRYGIKFINLNREPCLLEKLLLLLVVIDLYMLCDKNRSDVKIQLEK
jgi:hypothetical protein